MSSKVVNNTKDINDTKDNKNKITDDDLDFFRQNIKYYFTGVIMTIFVILLLIYFRNEDDISDTYQQIFCKN